MKKLFSALKKINWKYVVGEILLIFIGISLAIWFNNWNSSMQLNRNKNIVILKIKDEIENNLDELTKARKENKLLIDGFAEYKKLFGSNSSEVITSPIQMYTLQKKYPSFFRIKDSVNVKANLIKYSGENFINLELAELTEIAWKTAQTLNITNEFSYECLYELESIYILQTRVKNGLENAVTALQQNDIIQLMRILNILSQIEAQLEEDYQNMLNNINDCH